MNIILLGPQGSGKGTQAKLLSEKFGLFYFEMGDFLRELAKRDPAIDRIINKEGKLLPDDMFFFAMKKLLEKEIVKGRNLILDGFPRTESQYRMLKNWFDEKGLKIDKVIFLDISPKETIRRLSARRVCDRCGANYNLITNPPSGESCSCGGKLIQREDDQPKRIKVRLNEYRKNTQPLLEIFKKQGILAKVDGERPIAVIHQDLVKLVKEA